MSFNQNDASDSFENNPNLLDKLGLGNVDTSKKGGDEPKVPEEPQIRTHDSNQIQGDCLIFYYETYQKGRSLDSRPGASHDAQRLGHIFQELGFSVYPPYLDFPKSAVLEKLIKASEKDHSKSRFFVCCFLTHGKLGELSTYDKWLELQIILDIFSRHSCKSLAGKPKIFIFQACQGHGCEPSIVVQSDRCGTDGIGTYSHGDDTDGSGTDGGGLSTSDLAKAKSDHLDFLVINSTYPGMVSFKTKDQKNLHNYGSYFIDEFCHSMEQFSKELDLLEIVTIINYRLAYNFESCTKDQKSDKKKQMPCFRSNLRERIFFNKTISPFVSDATRFFDLRLNRCVRAHPFMDKETYVIKNCKSIQFLSVAMKKGDYSNQMKASAAHMWKCIASRDIEHRHEAKDNMSKFEIKTFLEKFAAEMFSGISCLVCFIATYYKDEFLLDSVRNKFLKEDVVEAFIGTKCMALAGKPKIFVFLMCKPPAKKSFFPCVSADRPRTTMEKIPIHADILEVAITCEEPEQITRSLKEFCEIFKENTKSEDFISMLTRINSNLEKNCGFYSMQPNEKQSILTVNSTLTKTLILP